jgi:hypothetical protein
MSMVTLPIIKLKSTTILETQYIMVERRISSIGDDLMKI